MPQSSPLLRRYAGIMLAERVTIGAAAALAPGPLLAAFGIADDEDSPTLRYFARLFGIRNAVLGVLLWQARNDPKRLGTLAAVNAATEILDAIAGSAPLVTRQGRDASAAAAVATSLAVSAGFAGLAIAARRVARPGE
ncbi:MAG: DUF4267 domain-containing protein [bacterium]